MVWTRGIRKTTSITGFTVDPVNVDNSESFDRISRNNNIDNYKVFDHHHHHHHHDQQYSNETPHFLSHCGLCNRRLAPGRDIYMYRGDSAFCSLECREQQIKKDERKEKLKILALSKKNENHSEILVSAANSDNCGKSNSIVAA